MQIRTLQYLRAIAAIGIVIYHIHLWERKALGSNAVTPSWLSSGDAGVDLFFVISGFIMVFIQPNRIDSLRSYSRFLSHRITRIYPPYWIVTSALLPIWIASPGLFNNFYDGHVDLLRSILLLPQSYTPLLGVGWTLIHEMYFYLIVSVALIFVRHWRWLFGGIWFGLVFITLIQYGDTLFNKNPFLQLVFSPFTLTFLLGYFIGLAHLQIRRMPSWVFLVVAGLGTAGLFAGFYAIPPVGVYPNNNHLFRFVAYGVPCSCLVFASVGLDASIKRRLAVLAVLGDASYSIYLIHLLVVAGFYAVVKMLHLHSVYITALSAIVCLLICLLASVIFHRVIESNLIRFFRDIIGCDYHPRRLTMRCS